MANENGESRETYPIIRIALSELSHNTGAEDNEEGKELVRGAARMTRADAPETQSNSLTPKNTVEQLIPFCDLIGYTCFAAWAFLAGWFEGFDPLKTGLEGDAFLIRIPFFVGAAVVALLLFLLDKPPFAIASRKTLAIFFAMCLGCSVTITVPVSPVATVALWLVSGMGQTLCFLTWSLRLKVLSKHQQLSVICGAFILSGFSLAIAPFMDSIASSIIFAVLPAASFACLLFAQHLFSPKNPSGEAPPKASVRNLHLQIPFEDDRHFVFMKGLHAALYSTLLGFVVCVALAYQFYPANETSMGIVCAAVSIALLKALRTKEKETCNFFPHAFIPTVGICMLLIGIAWRGNAALAFCLVLFGLFTCFEIVNAHTTYAYSAYDSIRCLWELHSSRAGSTLGVFVGWTIGYVAQYLCNIDDVGFLALCFSLTVALVIVDGALFKKQRMTLDMTENNDRESLAVTFPKEMKKAPSGKGKWMQACDDLSERYKLSPRQKEIFLLLAKGRNVQFIREELVLSTPTVKSHIYSIYQKMGIHSHQELIDAIENAVQAG